jgi:hypothetical protein
MISSSMTLAFWAQAEPAATPNATSHATAIRIVI